MILYKPNKLTLELSADELTYVLPNRMTLYHLQGDPQRLPEKNLIEWSISMFPGGVFVDIGANIGTWSLFYAASGKASKVVAFEPQDSTYKALCAGIALNGLEVETHKIALSDKSGEVPLRILSEDGGGSSICDLPTNLWPKRLEMVRLDTLDSFNLMNVGLVKIDTEGSELEVLKGAVQTLEASNWPKIFFEAWVIDWYAEKKQETFDYLNYLGYNNIVQVSGYIEEFIAERV